MSALVDDIWADSVYFAQPYSLDATGFYFSDPEEYRRKADANRDRFGDPVEEYELQYINGEYYKLFDALGVSQASLAEWFELLDELGGDEDRYLIACHLADDGYAMSELAAKWDDFRVFRGTAAEYAEQIVDECYEVPGNLGRYIDYERLGRDMVLEGSVIEIERDVLLLA